MVCLRIESTCLYKRASTGKKLKVFVPQSQKTYTFILDDWR